MNKPFKDRDANADYNGGFYTYTLPPDGDEAGRKYRFPDGNLCNRFKAYEIGDYYNKKNILKTVDGTRDMQVVFGDIVNILNA